MRKPYSQNVSQLRIATYQKFWRKLRQVLTNLSAQNFVKVDFISYTQLNSNYADILFVIILIESVNVTGACFAISERTSTVTVPKCWVTDRTADNVVFTCFATDNDCSLWCHLSLTFIFATKQPSNKHNCNSPRVKFSPFVKLIYQRHNCNI